MSDVTVKLGHERAWPKSAQYINGGRNKNTYLFRNHYMQATYSAVNIAFNRKMSTK